VLRRRPAQRTRRWLADWRLAGCLPPCFRKQIDSRSDIHSYMQTRQPDAKGSEL
jgi:hypothetical protein